MEHERIIQISGEPEYVIIRAKIGISDSFYRWVMKYGNNIEIVFTECIRNKFCEELGKIFEIHEK